MEEFKNFLNSLTILVECSGLERQTFGESLKRLAVPRGVVVFREGEKGSMLYIVQSGIIGSYTAAADRREISRFSRGMVFGEMSIIEAIPRTSTCYALTASVLYSLDAEEFLQFIWNYPMIGLKVLRGMLRNIITWLKDADNFLTNMVMWGEKARLKAITEPLTGLYNKRFFEESLQLNIEGAAAHNSTFALLLLDLDNFHQINTQLGQAAGDRIIQAVAAVLKSEQSGGQTMARLGGDEFALLIPRTATAVALRLAQELKARIVSAALDGSPRNPGFKGALTVSIGVAEYPLHGQTAAELKAAADRALMAAKEQGRNRVVGACEQVKRVALDPGTVNRL